MQKKVDRATIMYFEVTKKLKLNSHSVEKDMILHNLPDFCHLLFAQHFDGSLHPVSLPLLVASSLSLPPSSARSALPQSVGNAMESSRLCLEFICVQDRGGFLTSGRGCLGNV